jgi:hypothetical protein
VRLQRCQLRFPCRALMSFLLLARADTTASAFHEASATTATSHPVPSYAFAGVCERGDAPAGSGPDVCVHRQ